MVRRISGKYKANTVSHLKSNTNDITDVKEICNTLVIYQFLSDDYFKVRVGNIYSDPYSQEAGVPQGSFLSVTLFSLKINSIVSCLLHDIKCSLYVDDLAIYYSSIHLPSIKRKLQQSLNRLGRWCDDNGFTFSPTKTMYVHFCQLQKQHLDPQLYLNGTQIPIIGEAKFLGLLFDSNCPSFHTSFP